MSSKEYFDRVAHEWDKMRSDFFPEKVREKASSRNWGVILICSKWVRHSCLTCAITGKSQRDGFAKCLFRQNHF